MKRRRMAGWLTVTVGAAGLCLAAFGGASLGADHGPTTAKAPTTQTARPRSPADNYTVDDVREILRETNPELERRINAAMETAPDKVTEMVRSVLPKIKPILDVKKRDKDMYQLVLQDCKITRLCDEQARLARDAQDPADADNAKAKLRDLLHDRFGVRQKMRLLELQRAEEQLVIRRKQVDDRVKDENKEVEADFKRMTAPLPKPKPTDPKDGGLAVEH